MISRKPFGTEALAKILKYNLCNVELYLRSKIRYSPLPKFNGEVTTISNHHASFLCGQESGGPYSCRVANSLFRPNQMYNFQVTARNRHGDGSVSDPVTTESIPILYD